MYLSEWTGVMPSVEHHEPVVMNMPYMNERTLQASEKCRNQVW